MRGEAEAAYGFLDAPLVVKVRDARLLVCRSDRCVDVMFDAGLASQCRETLALRLFPLDARLSGILHGEDPPRASQRTTQGCLVIEITLDDFDALVRQRRCRLTSGLARQPAQIKPGALERPRNRAALIACHPGDENRSIACHVFPRFWMMAHANRAGLISSVPETAPGIEEQRPTEHKRRPGPKAPSLRGRAGDRSGPSERESRGC